MANISTFLKILIVSSNSKLSRAHIFTLPTAERSYLSLSKNKLLIDALENDDEDLGYIILSDIVKEIKKHTNNMHMIQIITANKDIFARSWDDTYAGMPIGDYRKDLDYFNTNKNLRSSIEIGRMLSFKTTIPIYRGELLIGYVEILDFFNDITSFMKNIGIDFYILMDEKYLDVAVFMRGNDPIDKYVIANKNHKYVNTRLLNSIDIKDIQDGKLLYKRKKYLWSKPMLNNEDKQLGLFVFVLDEKYLTMLSKSDENTLYFLNKDRATLYNARSNTMYKDILDELNLDENVLLSLGSIIEKSDKEKYINIIKNKLEKKDKDDLIKILLNQKQSSKINGEIR